MGYDGVIYDQQHDVWVRKMGLIPVNWSHVADLWMVSLRVTVVFGRAVWGYCRLNFGLFTSNFLGLRSKKPEKRGTKASFHKWKPLRPPAHRKLPARKGFNIEMIQVQRSPNCTESFEANIPIAANFLRVTPSKLEFFCWSKPVSITTESIKFPAQNTFKIGVPLPQLQQTRKHHDRTYSSGRLPKTLLVSYLYSLKQNISPYRFLWLAI